MTLRERNVHIRMSSPRNQNSSNADTLLSLTGGSLAGEERRSGGGTPVSALSAPRRRRRSRDQESSGMSATGHDSDGGRALRLLEGDAARAGSSCLRFSGRSDIRPSDKVGCRRAVRLFRSSIRSLRPVTARISSGSRRGAELTHVYALALSQNLGMPSKDLEPDQVFPA